MRVNYNLVFIFYSLLLYVLHFIWVPLVINTHQGGVQCLSWFVATDPAAVLRHPPFLLNSLCLVFFILFISVLCSVPFLHMHSVPILPPVTYPRISPPTCHIPSYFVAILRWDSYMCNRTTILSALSTPPPSLPAIRDRDGDSDDDPLTAASSLGKDAAKISQKTSSKAGMYIRLTLLL